VREGPWTIEVYESPRGVCPYERFLDELDDVEAAALDAAIVHVLAPSGIDLARSEWLKPLKEGLYEFRVRHDASEIAAMFAARGVTVPAASGPVLLRVFCTFHGDKVVLLLAGYDKGGDPSDKRQQREIAAARKLLTAWKMEQDRRRAAARKGRR
jgi:putative component of toxin-antitoxin plasmid stabilization module